jgi:ADP-ribose pyrophosphatase YjhB (NUDIX family)
LNFLELLDELRILAQNGLHYAANDYDVQRYTRILELVSNAYTTALDMPVAEVRARLARELGHVTPKIGADAAVFDAHDRLLLVRRADDRCWCLPCGWVEPSESPEHAAIRETREETGLDIRILEQLGAIHRFPSERHGPHAVLSVVFLGEVRGGQLTTSPETLDVAFRAIDEVTDWHKNHQELAQLALLRWVEYKRRAGDRVRRANPGSEAEIDTPA